jgi:hypothetical protein
VGYPDLLIALAPPFALYVPVSPLGCQRSAVLQSCPSARPGVQAKRAPSRGTGCSERSWAEGVPKRAEGGALRIET